MIIKKVFLRHLFIKFFIALLAIALFVKADVIDHTQIEMVLSNMGEVVNTSGDEFYPTITADGTKMVFSVRPKEKENSDIYMSVFKNGAWQRPQPISEINTNHDEQTPYISPDGKLIIFSSNREGTIRPLKIPGEIYYYTNDLYITKFENGRWSTPIRLTGDVNTEENERAPSLSRDGKILYFSRYPGDSIEKSKIYQAELEGNNTSKVQLLPHPINSGYSDFGLLESRNKPGFYFSSSRPGGRGLWDIYYVSFTNGRYGKPINLGFPVNSEANDLTITEIGNVVFFCSDRAGGIGNTDIYTITLSPKVFQSPDTGFAISVINKQTRQPVAVEFRIEERKVYGKSSKDERIYAQKSDAFGKLEIKVSPTTKEVILHVNDERFEPLRQQLIPEEGIMKNISVFVTPFQPEEISAEIEAPAIQFRPIYFDFASSKIPMREMPNVLSIIQKLRNNPSLCVKIIGHTDAKGREFRNYHLGLKRAKAIKEAFVNFGLSRFRYKLESKGESEPSNEYLITGQEQFNRRVEFELIDCKEIDDDEELP
ncbi:MAG: OmpA family protein [Spirochaetes bacterium]|nr:OmpA family protein [Spirochaetota bacterium]